MLLIELSAEREGFEPPVPLSTTVFKTVVIDHSTISPVLELLQKRVQNYTFNFIYTNFRAFFCRLDTKWLILYP